MVDSKIKELEQAELLKNAGNFEEALNTVNKLEDEKILNEEELLSLKLFKSTLLLDLRHLQEALELAEEVLDQSKIINRYDKSIEALHNIAWVHRRLGKLEESLADIANAEKVIDTHFPEPNKEIQEKIASLYLIKGSIFFARGNLDLIKKSLEKGLELAKRSDDKKLLMHFTINFGTYYGIKGNLERATEYHSHGLILAKQISDKQNIIIALNNLGWVYREQGKLDEAFERINESYTLCKEINSPTLPIVLDSLFHIALDRSDLDLAQKYLDQMTEFKDQEEYEIIKLNYMINKALLLKANPRARNLVKAEKILRKAVEEDIVLYEAHIDALLNLCDLLIIDLRNTNDLEIIKEIEPFITRLLDIAEQNKSYPLTAEINLLQARLALLNFNVIKARQLLSKAQRIAEKYGLNRLSMKISNDHDELLKQMDIWENLRNSNSSLSERIKLTNIEEHMKRMIQKRTVETPKLLDEEPLLLLIMAQGGLPIFSHYFSGDWQFSDDLFSGFLTAFDSISKEIFSEGLDRAKFGQHTILINSIENFLICYLFKGQSYFAKQKLGNFTDHLQSSSSLWKALNKFTSTFQVLDIKDIPLLQSLIDQIFTNKISEFSF